MRLIFGGVEIPSNRTLLERNGVKHVMLNYWGLRKRGLPKTKPYLIGEHFLPDMKVWVDSGATQADKAGLSQRELEEYAADYEEFIALNYDRIEGWVEFDSQVMGLPWIISNRASFETDPKMWVVWHETYTPMVLQKWAAEFSNIAIPGDAIEATTTLSGIVRGLKAQYPTKFHALATAKPDNLRQIPFDTASTLAWISPMRRGETIVWDGGKLVRYPKAMKDQARLRYKSLVERAGLDFQKFVNDDTLEATKVAVWSYLQLEANMDKNNRNFKAQKDDMLSDNNDDTLYTGLMEMGGGSSNNSGSDMRKLERQEVVQRDPQEVVSMPVFGYEMKTVVETENGRDVLKDVPLVRSQTSSLRQCDTCFVAANCPAFKPQNTCAFSLPVEVKTPEQLRAMNTALLEMQAMRVAFMRFSEELNGGYADPNVSNEMDRYFKMLKAMKELDESKEFIQITAQKSAGQGVLSAIFGDRVQAMREVQPVINEEQTTMIIRDSIE
ncbi:hypothetical protein UFOVP223_24 [uncultured Caudovirales phage]|uniref:Uncharacterized protein n=1 Tax=uncultured Caudovirales phage TaxID=2100421 RepID=A0A6J7WLU9_9CAUD|nr:hypothetical protein UFOVP110_6 [uncultured Caudovirales phage]CAB5219071.1 hypothetical protein UFOVP223_24 [uncultured Caudovirales phage]